MENLTAKQVCDYYAIYKEYLLDNNLDDDSSSITVLDLVYFVEEYIEPDFINDFYQKISSFQS